MKNRWLFQLAGGHRNGILQVQRYCFYLSDCIPMIYHNHQQFLYALSSYIIRPDLYTSFSDIIIPSYHNNSIIAYQILILWGITANFGVQNHSQSPICWMLAVVLAPQVWAQTHASKFEWFSEVIVLGIQVCPKSYGSCLDF